MEAVSGSWWRVGGGGGADLVASWCRSGGGLVPVGGRDVEVLRRDTQRRHLANLGAGGAAARGSHNKPGFKVEKVKSYLSFY